MSRYLRSLLLLLLAISVLAACAPTSAPSAADKPMTQSINGQLYYRAEADYKVVDKCSSRVYYVGSLKDLDKNGDTFTVRNYLTLEDSSLMTATLHNDTTKFTCSKAETKLGGWTLWTKP